MWDPAWSRIDWSRDAAHIVALVKACAPHEGAFTRWNGARVVVESAVELLEDHPVPPGVVVSSTADCVVVATGTTAVRISALRDGIGAVDLRALVPGTRLGADVAGELEALSQRVADLESLVRYLTNRRDWERT